MSRPMGQSLNLLMYHSISDGPGPTNIPLDAFTMQLDVLAELGYRTVSLSELVAWHQGQAIPPRSALITFDDAFRDFGQLAWPELQQRGFGATVFVPTGYVGKHDGWEDDAGQAARELLSWDEVKRLASAGVEFGGHTVHHEDLTKLTLRQARDEILLCKQMLQQHLDLPVVAFAPPFGRVNDEVKSVIRETFSLSFGTMLGRATRQSDRWDLPRIEMHYFRNRDRWRTHLLGGGAWRFAARCALRSIRQQVTRFRA